MAALREMKVTLTPALSIKTHQRWNATVMANIWAKRATLDVGLVSSPTLTISHDAKGLRGPQARTARPRPPQGISSQTKE